jgi:3D (Asp-Asp-Asp) domain-containing protein
MDIGLRLFKILAIFSLFSFLLVILVMPNFSRLKSPPPEVNFPLIEKPILESPGYSIVQSNSLLAISSIHSNESPLAETSERETIMATVTGYILVEWETDDTPCIIASGLNACEETDKNIVACPRKYSFGTKVLINGKVYICEDRTNIKYDGIFDILFRSEEEMQKWGKRILPVTILN